MGLPGYDAWKLASPPEYDAPDVCPSCESQLVDGDDSCKCGWSAEGAADDEYGRYLDAQADKADADRDDRFDAECEARR